MQAGCGSIPVTPVALAGTPSVCSLSFQPACGCVDTWGAELSFALCFQPTCGCVDPSREELSFALSLQPACVCVWTLGGRVPASPGPSGVVHQGCTSGRGWAAVRDSPLPQHAARHSMPHQAVSGGCDLWNSEVAHRREGGIRPSVRDASQHDLGQQSSPRCSHCHAHPWPAFGQTLTTTCTHAGLLYHMGWPSTCTRQAPASVGLRRGVLTLCTGLRTESIRASGPCAMACKPEKVSGRQSLPACGR